MKITTRYQLIKLIAKRAYEDRCINDYEDYGTSTGDWRFAENVVAFYLDFHPRPGNWLWQQDNEDYDKFKHFITNYLEHATDRVLKEV